MTFISCFCGLWFLGSGGTLEKHSKQSAIMKHAQLPKHETNVTTQISHHMLTPSIVTMTLCLLSAFEEGKEKLDWNSSVVGSYESELSKVGSQPFRQ